MRILKDLEFNCPRKDTGKYKTFFVSRKKEVKRIWKYGEEITKSISYKLKFIDSGRFMASSSSNLVDNLAEEIHKIKWKYENFENINSA